MARTGMTLFVRQGQRIGKGVVLDPEIRVTEGKSTRRGARLRCDCGNVYEAPLSKLVERGSRKVRLSCGCAGTVDRRRLHVEVGQRIGRGVVIDPDIRMPLTPGQKKAGYVNGKRGARLQCDCGNVYEAQLLSLVERNGRINTVSCGCALKEHIRRVRGAGSSGNNRKHGLSNHPLYLTWRQMLRRCENPEAHNYPRYGGRGIKVCPEWHDVTVFISDLEGFLGSRPEGCTLDRIEVDGDYEMSNVRWAPAVSQAQNRGNSVRLIICKGCRFRMRAVYGWLSWWECPACGTHNLPGIG